MKYWFFAILMLNAHLLCATTQAMYTFETPQQASQFNHLLHDLRCVVCQNQDLADSHAALAHDLREEVYRLVKQGQSDQMICHYLVDRYGDFILFKPPLKGITALLWGGPLLLMCMGLWIFIRYCRRSLS